MVSQHFLCDGATDEQIENYVPHNELAESELTEGKNERVGGKFAPAHEQGEKTREKKMLLWEGCSEQLV